MVVQLAVCLSGAAQEALFVTAGGEVDVSPSPVVRQTGTETERAQCQLSQGKELKGQRQRELNGKVWAGR